MLLGLLEVVVFIGRYLDLLDITREAARFASVRDFSVVNNLVDADCRPKVTKTIAGVPTEVEPPFHFYYQTSCLFSPPQGSQYCTGANDPWCNGVNSFVRFDHATDDIVISVYTITNNHVSNTWPQPDGVSTNGTEQNGFWAFSDNDGDTTNNGNWKYDCQGHDASHEVRTAPYFDYNRVNNGLGTGLASIGLKGYVAVEFYYCYHQVLGITGNAGINLQIFPDPMRIHAYTLMPLPSAQPTPTPKTP
jgi:hypothetical protein